MVVFEFPIKLADKCIKMNYIIKISCHEFDVFRNLPLENEAVSKKSQREILSDSPIRSYSQSFKYVLIA